MKAKTKNDKLLRNHLLATLDAFTSDKGVIGNAIFLPDVYLPNIDSPLMVSVEVGGENQTGTSNISIMWDSGFKEVITHGSTQAPVPVRSCKSLDMQTLLIIARVTDTNQDSENNITSITVKLTAGGKEVYKDHHETIVSNEGETAQFIYKISCYVI
jgi:hypothetical protein